MLSDLLKNLPQLDKWHDFGEDINEVHKDIFSKNKEQVETDLRNWLSTKQPCVFGKLASKKLQGLDYHLTILDAKDLSQPDYLLFTHST